MASIMDVFANAARHRQYSLAPPDRVAYLLEQVVDPDAVVFSDWSTVNLGNDGNTASGECVLVAGERVVVASYADVRPVGAAGEETPGTLDIGIHRIDTVRSVRWRAGDLNRRELGLGAIGDVTVAGDGWSVDLPLEPLRTGALGYLIDLRQAVGL